MTLKHFLKPVSTVILILQYFYDWNVTGGKLIAQTGFVEWMFAVDSGISPCAPAGLSLSVPPSKQSSAELPVTHLSVLITRWLLPNHCLV